MFKVTKDFIEGTARICHTANTELCKSQGDYSHEAWANTSPELRESIRAGVLAQAQNPGLMPEDMHELWMLHKIEAGWVVGWEKDEAKKTHPNLVPYVELSSVEQAKDFIFHAIVREMIQLAQFGVNMTVCTDTGSAVPVEEKTDA